ncbi:hypothetical protein BDP81DRAFT_435821 [Colletotrichum phormii]|uniref:Uncharacterized protein n=1 Tax=Colletotrichum phormii TaxID=359342 RepID=A0AAJ0EBC0_9PEZI|nr:uncharacterized protein BDP81DRAFT_435821 [Colletotrichum phormii]KAK1625441.1 hypothetical protein BDP81DRAFT_435821 [Colletotrichum phormii]
MAIYLSIHPSFHPSYHLFTYLPIYLSIYLFTFLLNLFSYSFQLAGISACPNFLYTVSNFCDECIVEMPLKLLRAIRDPSLFSLLPNRSRTCDTLMFKA